MKLFVHLIVFFFSVISPPLYALSEETIKAAYLERIAAFIEWPTPIHSYRVCIYNDPSFAKVLQTSYANRSFNKVPLQVISLPAGAATDEMSECHIVYYRSFKPLQNEKQIAFLQKKHVLTIGDNESDPRKGTSVGFNFENNTYRLIINQRNLENSSLKASYRLLNFATVIEPTGGIK